MRMMLGRWVLMAALCSLCWGCEPGSEAGTAAVRLLRGGAGEAYGLKVTEPSPGERLTGRRVMVRGWAGEGISAVMVEEREAVLLRSAWQAELVLEPGQKSVTVAALSKGQVVATARVAVEPPQIGSNVKRVVAEVRPRRVAAGGRATVSCVAEAEDGLPITVRRPFAIISSGPVTALDSRHYRTEAAGRAAFVCMTDDATLSSDEALLEVLAGPTVRTVATVNGLQGEVVAEAGERLAVGCRSFDAGGAERRDEEAVAQFDWLGDGVMWEGANLARLTRAGEYRLRCLSPGAKESAATRVVVTPQQSSLRAEVSLQPAREVVGGDQVRLATARLDQFGNRVPRGAGRPELWFAPEDRSEPVSLVPVAGSDEDLTFSVPRVGGRLEVRPGTVTPGGGSAPPDLPTAVTVQPASSVPLRGQCGPALMVEREGALAAYRIGLIGFDPTTDEVEVEGNGHLALHAEADGRGARMAVTAGAAGSWIDVWQPVATGRNFVGFKLYRNIWEGRWHRRELLFEDFCTYLTAPRIVPFGEPVAHALEGRMNQVGLDDGGATATAIASVVNTAVTASNFTAQLEAALQADPVLLEGVTADDYYNELDHCEASLNPLDWGICLAEVLGETLEAVSNAVGVSRIWDACVEAHEGVRASDPQLSLWFSSNPDEPSIEARVEVGRIEVPLNRCIFDDPHGMLQLKNLSVHARFGVAVSEGLATVRAREVEIESLDVEGYLSFLGADFSLPSSAVARAREQAEVVLEQELSRYLSMALTQRPLESFDIGFALPPLGELLGEAPAAERARAGFQMQLSELHVSPNGYLQAGVASRMSGVSGGRSGLVAAMLMPSYLLPGSGAPVVPPTAHEPLGVSLQQGWLNGFGHAAWQAGFMDGYLPMRTFSASAQDAFTEMLSASVAGDPTELERLRTFSLDEGGLGIGIASELPISLEGFDAETGDAWLGVGPVVMDLSNCAKAGCPSVATLPMTARLAAGALGLVPPVRVAARLRARLEVGESNSVEMRGLNIRSSSLAEEDLWVALDRSLTPAAVEQALAVAGLERSALVALVTQMLTEEVVPALGTVGPVAFPAFRTDFAGLGSSSSLAVTLVDETELLELDRLSSETGRFFVTTGLQTALSGGVP